MRRANRRAFGTGYATTITFGGGLTDYSLKLIRRIVYAGGDAAPMTPDTASSEISRDSTARSPYSCTVSIDEDFLSSEDDDEADREACIICLDNFCPGDVLIALGWYHLYHEECGTVWLRKKNSCPMCNRPALEPSRQHPYVLPAAVS